MFILSGLSLSRPVDTKTDFNLINIIATLSLIQYFFGNKIRRQISWHVLKLDLNSARWMPKLVSIDALSYAALTSQTLLATIDPCQANRPLFHYVILRHWNLRNLTLKKECYLTNISLDHSRFFRLHSTFARLYNAAAKPASRLRSTGYLAIRAVY